MTGNNFISAIIIIAININIIIYHRHHYWHHFNEIELPPDGVASDDDVNDIDVYSRKSHLPLSQWSLSICQGEFTSLQSSASSPPSYSHNNFDFLKHDLHILNHLPLSLICVHHGTSLEILISTTFQSSNNNGGKDNDNANVTTWLQI